MKEKSVSKNNNSVDGAQKDLPLDIESNNLPPNEPRQPAHQKRGKLRRFFVVLLYTIVVILIITPAVAFLFRDPVVQSLSARLATIFLSNQIGNEISIKTIRIGLKADIHLEGVWLKDSHDSIMIRVDKLDAYPVLVDLLEFGPKFSKIILDGVEFKLSYYQGEDDFSFIQFIDKFSSDTTTTSSESSGNFILKTRKLILTNAKFHLYDETTAYDSEGQMNYSDIVFDHINLHATNFLIFNDSIDFSIDSMSVTEKSGISVKKMSTDFMISSTGLQAKNLLMDVNNSRLDLDLDFIYSDYSDYGSFLDSIVIRSDIRPSSLDMSNLKYFAEQLGRMPNLLEISGKVDGTVSDFMADNLRISYGEHTEINLDGGLRGLPDIYMTHIDVEFHKLKTNSCELKLFRLPTDEGNIDITEYLGCSGKDLKAKGKFKGYYNDFRANLDLETNEGKMNLIAKYTNIENDTIKFDVALKARSLRLGKLLKLQNILGKADLDVQFKGGGDSFDELSVSGGGNINNFSFMGYNYSRMRVTSTYQHDSLRAAITVGDRHLMMNAGIVGVFTNGEYLAVSADIKRADLDDLHLWSEQDFSFEGLADVEINNFDPDLMTGYVILNDPKFSFGEDYYKLQETILKKNIDKAGVHSLSVESDFVDAELSGKYLITTLPERIQAMINHYFYLINDVKPGNFPEGEYVNLTGVLKRSDLLEEQFISGLSFSPNTSFSANISFDSNEIMASALIDKMMVGGIEFRDNNFGVDMRNNRVVADFNTGLLLLKDSTETDKTVFGLDNFHVNSTVGQDSLTYKIYWKNLDSLVRNSGDLQGEITTNDRSTSFRINTAEVFINDTLWTVDPENLIVRDSSGVYFKDLTISGGESKMTIAGKYPEKNGDTLAALFNHWNLSNFDVVTKPAGLDLDGITEGYLKYGIINDNPTFLSDIKIEGLALNKEKLGTAYIMNSWNNEESSILIDSRIERTGSSGTGDVFSIKGLYYPFEDENSIDLGIAFNRFKLVTLEPFFEEFVSDMEGVASGEFKLSGTPSKPILTGYVDANRTMMKVRYLNTKYSFSNRILFEPDRINFDNVVIYDTLNNSARVDGSLKHHNFQDMAFDLSIKTDKLLFFNTTRKMNDLYYGSAITSGSIYIKGDPRNITMSMQVKTEEGTNVFLPLEYSAEISDKDYIIFVQHEDTLSALEEYDKKVADKKAEEKLGFDLNLGLEITPVAKVAIYLPSDMGKIESQGYGDLTMRTNSNGDFTLLGDYVIDEGSFLFSLGNLVSKRFELVRGGRISWTGDPYTASVNLKGLYKVKTTLSSLGIVVDSALMKSKVNVECYVVLQNMLLNPDIRFEILFPGLSTDLQRAVYAELDTTNQAMMNNQMISILVLGTFSYSNAANISLGSTSYNVLTNQLGSMLSRMSDKFDIGLNYRPGDNVTSDEFEVALSTALFDDRLIIDGNLGMSRDNATQSNASNIVGDVDIGYKITPDGRWILKAFNHSNVNSWYNYSSDDKVSPYTQGVGIAYRKEFTHISELFKRVRPRKNQKDENEEENNPEINKL